jgi:hypothetical protein
VPPPPLDGLRRRAGAPKETYTYQSDQRARSIPQKEPNIDPRYYAIISKRALRVLYSIGLFQKSPILQKEPNATPRETFYLACIPPTRILTRAAGAQHIRFDITVVKASAAATVQVVLSDK